MFHYKLRAHALLSFPVILNEVKNPYRATSGNGFMPLRFIAA